MRPASACRAISRPSRPLAPGIAAQNGILIKSAEALQQMSALGTVVFDKTGTLTEGRPSVVSCELLDPQVRGPERWAGTAGAEM